MIGVDVLSSAQPHLYIARQKCESSIAFGMAEDLGSILMLTSSHSSDIDRGSRIVAHT
jgi:hypothetical protein